MTVRGRSVALGALGAVVAALAFPVASISGRAGVGALQARADSRALLLIAEDAGGPDASGARWLEEERRADAIVVLRWFRSCDRLQVLSVPRDLVLSGEQTLSVTYGTEGAGAVEDAIERLLGVAVFARITTDLDDVRGLVDAIGPVTVDLPAESRDLRTGFAAGPGPVPLDGAAAVAYLRARTWEEHERQGWSLADSADDEGRIERLQAFGRSGLDRLGQLGMVERLRFAATVARRIDLTVADRLAMAGFAIGVRHVNGVSFGTVPVRPERTVDERRSPFAPNDLGAVARSVLAGGAAAVARQDACAADGGAVA